ncbi:hypothetical protein LR48_Vigan10g065400 [Vigna angularis]|uniref:Uncharacterized protein n=2 Tax=Phaseolus angularis TaxID=3914 RepID=A0A0L9VIM4_PHAAN|nr:hypothetical protein LR48_Vigan10g065400 [Vigna angularis]BAT88732.1 hypothetical protein VIGAN_05232200 [Vigna angularis var. angularis]
MKILPPFSHADAGRKLDAARFLRVPLLFKPNCWTLLLLQINLSVGPFCQAADRHPMLFIVRVLQLKDVKASSAGLPCCCWLDRERGRVVGRGEAGCSLLDTVGRPAAGRTSLSKLLDA